VPILLVFVLQVWNEIDTFYKEDTDGSNVKLALRVAPCNVPMDKAGGGVQLVSCDGEEGDDDGDDDDDVVTGKRKNGNCKKDSDQSKKLKYQPVGAFSSFSSFSCTTHNGGSSSSNKENDEKENHQRTIKSEGMPKGSSSRASTCTRTCTNNTKHVPAKPYDGGGEAPAEEGAEGVNEESLIGLYIPEDRIQRVLLRLQDYQTKKTLQSN